jgi:hypothetical protein
MSRTIDSGLLTALTGNLVNPYYAVELFFDSSTLRFWTGLGDRTIGGETYIGTGSLLNIAAAEEVGDLSAKGMVLTLTGLESSIISLALQEPYQRRVAKVYLGEQSVTPVVQIFSGFMDTMQISDEPETATVVLTIESKLVELERSRNWRYTDESHKARYSGDSFFSFVQDIQDQQVAWGRSAG